MEKMNPPFQVVAQPILKKWDKSTQNNKGSIKISPILREKISFEVTLVQIWKMRGRAVVGSQNAKMV